MARSRLLASVAAMGALALAGGATFGKSIVHASGTNQRNAVAAEELNSVASFEGIREKRARSIALFEEAAKVIQSPRCLNCHPSGDRPTQHDTMTPHQPLVVRGDDGLGATGMRCGTCHGEANYDQAHVPGNEKWRLAPPSMAWQGKSKVEICEQIKDPTRNGGRNTKELIDHSAHDSLVAWGWKPGFGLSPAPGTQERFGELVAAWLGTGGACPSR